MQQPAQAPAAAGVLALGIAAACLFSRPPQDAAPDIDLAPLVLLPSTTPQPLLDLKAESTPPTTPLPVTGARSLPPPSSPFDAAGTAQWPRLALDYPEPQSAPTHTVVDGDTLARLAQRYLGSAERQHELFEANRAVLSNPELLPIGAVLRIPTATSQR